MSSDDLAQRLSHRVTELELGFMSLERLVEELSGVIAEQQKTIAALSADLVMLNHKAGGFSEVDRAAPQDERPPHY